MSGGMVRVPRAQRLGAIGRWTAAAAGWLIVSWIIGDITVLLLPLLLIAGLLVPIGVVYGVVIRSMLVVRRRRAARSVGPSRPPRFGWRLRRADLVLAVMMLAVAVLGGGFWVVEGALEAHGFVSNNTSVLGNLLGVGALELGIVVELLVAIPIAAVNITRQVLDVGLLTEEARVLAVGGVEARRIRAVRMLSWVAYAVCSLGAVGSLVSLVPSFL